MGLGFQLHLPSSPFRMKKHSAIFHSTGNKFASLKTPKNSKPQIFLNTCGKMRLGILRTIFSKTLTLTTRTSASPVTTSSFLSSSLRSEPKFILGSGSLIPKNLSPWTHPLSHLHSLTDTRYPKRRPLDKPRRKRASLRPPGPYAWVKYVPGQPILPNQPNEGSVKGRNRKKRIRLHRAFIRAEAKKRKAQLQEAKRKKMNKRVERKMAAVARERAWAQRLVELKQQEEEKKKSVA